MTLVSHPRCPFCHDQVKPGEPKVGCEACMAWHHRPCWKEGGGCSACRAKARGDEAVRLVLPSQEGPPRVFLLDAHLQERVRTALRFGLSDEAQRVCLEALHDVDVSEAGFRALYEQAKAEGVIDESRAFYRKALGLIRRRQLREARRLCRDYAGGRPTWAFKLFEHLRGIAEGET